ncbi:MAG: hypothetical protein IJN02_11115 [Bacteroidales bacterium]|nr:hypothetical protein [Bacteroidales bacterium]
MKKIFFAIVSTLLMAGCAKENLVEPMGPQDGVTVLTAGTPSTKTILQNDQKVLWTNGDKINVNGVESNALAIEEDAVATATFTIPGTLSNPYKALFPASIYKDAQTVTLPAVQAYAENSFGATAAPMAAYQANGNNLSFKHLCAVLKLTIKKAEDAHDIMYVEFSGKNDEQVCGDFSIDYQKAELTGVSTSTSAKKVRCNVYNELSEEGLVVYLVVPAVEYASGYTIKVVDTKGHYMEKSKASGQTLEKGKIYDMPAFTFDPTGTEFNVGITTAQDLIDFAKAYNDGTTPAVAAILNDIEFTAQDCANYQMITNFAGTLKGNHYTISGWDAGKPIVYEASSGSLIENLTVDGSATLDGPNNIEANGRFKVATFVIHPKGSIVNCHNRVDYTLSGEVSLLTTVGGIAADTKGGCVIRDCVNYGNIDIASDFMFKSTNSSHIMCVGGIAGRFGGAGDLIENCSQKGRLQVLGSHTGSALAYVGGIAGYVSNTGKITGCNTYPIADANKATDGTHKATILLALSVENNINSYLGGIAGRLVNGSAVIENCTNSADVLCNEPESYQIFCGGIVGYGDSGTVTSSNNRGAVSCYSNSTRYFIGGLIGQSGCEVSNCKNDGQVLVSTPPNAKCRCTVGGLIAYNKKSTISQLTNNGDVMVEQSEKTSYYFIRLGGCIGLNSADIAGNNAIQNNGDIVWNSVGGWTTSSSMNFGGVIGMTERNVNGCINNGKVLFNESTSNATGANLYLGGIVGYTNSNITISGCTNTNNGRVDFNVTKGNEDVDNSRNYDAIYAGGILGYNENNNVNITGCNNAASVVGGLEGKKNNGADKHFGGIVGYLTGTSSISSCNMTGSVNNQDYNNESGNVDNGVTCGGIVGYAVGSETGKITISDCNVKNNDKSVTVAGLRGRVGGVAGCVKYAEISNCHSIVTSKSGHQYYGGICGDMVASSATGCTAVVEHTSSLNIAAGGLAGRLDGASKLDQCIFRGALAKNGGNDVFGLLAGMVTATGAQITNCQYLGTINGEESINLIGSYADGVTVDLSTNQTLSE